MKPIKTIAEAEDIIKDRIFVHKLWLKTVKKGGKMKKSDLKISETCLKEFKTILERFRGEV